MAAAIETNPTAELTVDLVKSEILCGEDAFPCTIPDSARTALTTGQFDFLSQLLEGEDQIRSTAERLPYMTGFSSDAAIT